jgi:6-phosphogluconolactonase
MSPTFDFRRLTIDGTGHFLYLADPYYSSVRGFSIDSASGALTPVPGSPFSSPAGPSDIAADPRGKYVYAISGGSDREFSYAIDPASGELTQVPPSGIPGVASPEGITTDPGGRFVYIVTSALVTNFVAAYAINSETGVLANLAGSPYPLAFNGGGAPQNIAIEPSGKFSYAVERVGSGTAGVCVSAIERATGAVSKGTTTATDANQLNWMIAFLQ